MSTSISTQSAPYVLITTDTPPSTTNGGGGSLHCQPGTNSTPPRANPPASIIIKRLTNVSFFGAIVALGFIVPGYILCLIAPVYTYGLTRDLGWLGFFVLLALFLSLLNRTSIHSSGTTPLTLNIIFDFGLAFSIGAWIVSTINDLHGNLGYRQCGSSWTRRSCLSWTVVICVVLGLGMLAALIVSIAHVTMFLLRCMNAWRSRFWARPFPWFASLPAGQVAFEFAVRVVKADGESDRGGDLRSGDQSARVEEGRDPEVETLVEV